MSSLCQSDMSLMIEFGITFVLKRSVDEFKWFPIEFIYFLKKKFMTFQSISYNLIPINASYRQLHFCHESETFVTSLTETSTKKYLRVLENSVRVRRFSVQKAWK